MKIKLMAGILVAMVLLCQGFAFAAEQQDPVVTEETVAVTEDAATGNVTGEAVEVDELYAPAPATAKEIKVEAKTAIKEIKAEEKEALKEAKKA